MPFALYRLWRTVVSPTRALFISCAVMLVDIGGNFMLVNVPYAFLANSLFVPWWLHYLEGIGERNSSTRDWAIGSVLGAFLFATYFYPFFILALWIVARITATAARIKLLAYDARTFVRSCAILLGAAAISSPYWFPVMRSVYHFGSDRSRGDWHHAGSPGVTFPFLDLTPIGIILMLAVGFALWRNRSRWARMLIFMVGTCLLYFLVGSVLGALDRPVNLIKCREFSWAVLAPLVGLGGYTLYAQARAGRSAIFLAYGVAIVASIFAVRGLSSLARSSAIDTAIKTQVPDFRISPEDTRALSGSVLLSSNEEIFAFVPAYAFICVNEHYSHPASRFALRYDFLNILQRAKNPWLLHLALRHNVFDPIDYVMPEKRGDSYYFTTALSTYPDRLKQVETRFDAVLLQDTALFTRITGPNLHRVRTSELVRSVNLNDLSGGDSVPPTHWIAMIFDRVDSAGRNELKQALGKELDGLNDCMKSELEYPITPRLVLVGCTAASGAGGIHITTTVRVNRPGLEVLRMYLHVYPDLEPREMLNIDFPPNFDTHAWQVGDLISIDRTVPGPVRPFGFTLGFFSPETPVGRPFDGHYYVGGRLGQSSGPGGNSR